MYQATLTGHEIFIDQKHRSALEMRDVIEQIIAHPKGVEVQTLAEIQRHTKLFWINNGPYNNLTARKFVLTCTAQAFAAAATLFDTYGIHFDPKLRDEVVKRVNALNLQSYTGFVMPMLTPVTGSDGGITDVRISYPMDLTSQMLDYSGDKTLDHCPSTL